MACFGIWDGRGRLDRSMPPIARPFLDDDARQHEARACLAALFGPTIPRLDQLTTSLSTPPPTTHHHHAPTAARPGPAAAALLAAAKQGCEDGGRRLLLGQGGADPAVHARQGRGAGGGQARQAAVAPHRRQRPGAWLLNWIKKDRRDGSSSSAAAAAALTGACCSSYPPNQQNNI